MYSKVVWWIGLVHEFQSHSFVVDWKEWGSNSQPYALQASYKNTLSSLGLFQSTTIIWFELMTKTNQPCIFFAARAILTSMRFDVFLRFKRLKIFLFFLLRKTVNVKQNFQIKWISVKLFDRPSESLQLFLNL